MIRTQQDIEKELVQGTIAETDQVTYFGRGGVVRGILRAISAVMAETQNDVTQIKRASFVDRATGTDLDTIGNRKGITRRGSSKSSTIVVFSGTPGTVIPAGTAIRSSVTNTVYTTQEDVVIGAKNPDFNGVTTDISLSDATIVESNLSGSQSKSAVNTLTKIAIDGVTCTNPAPTTGGEDSEPDEVYRQRIKYQNALLNQNNATLYESLAIEANNDVVRAIAIYQTGYTETVYVVKNSGGVFSNVELAAIKKYLQVKRPALRVINVFNLTFTEILITAHVHLETAANINDVIKRISDRIAAYIDWRTWQPESSVIDDTIYSIIADDAGVYDIANDTFQLQWTTDRVTYHTVNGNVPISNISLPRFASLSIKDLQTAETTTITVDQRYLTE